MSTRSELRASTRGTLPYYLFRAVFVVYHLSRNNAWLALLTLGEGWHNNHHHYMSSARQGFFWWELDASYWAIRMLARLGLVWDVREPPAAVLREGLRRAG